MNLQLESRLDNREGRLVRLARNMVRQIMDRMESQDELCKPSQHALQSIEGGNEYQWGKPRKEMLPYGPPHGDNSEDVLISPTEKPFSSKMSKVKCT